MAPLRRPGRIHAHSLLLNIDCRVLFLKVSRTRPGQWWAELTGYAYNPATLTTTQTVAFERLEPIEEQIKTRLTQAQVCHFDETGVRVEGKLHWLHVACNDQYTHLFVHPKRGKEAFSSEQSVFEACHNWTVHDCWSSYFSAGKGRHSLCGAHLLRELTALLESGSHWANAMHAYLLRAYQATRCGPLALAEQDRWRVEYEQLCHQSDAEELPALVFFKADGSTGRSKRTKGRNLLERLIVHQAAVLAFAFEPGVPFTARAAPQQSGRAGLAPG